MIFSTFSRKCWKKHLTRRFTRWRNRTKHCCNKWVWVSCFIIASALFHHLLLLQLTPTSLHLLSTFLRLSHKSIRSSYFLWQILNRQEWTLHVANVISDRFTNRWKILISSFQPHPIIFELLQQPKIVNIANGLIVGRMHCYLQSSGESVRNNGVWHL